MKKLILGAAIGIALGAVGMFFLLPRPTPAVCPDAQVQAAATPKQEEKKTDAVKPPKKPHISEDMSDFNKRDERKKPLQTLP